MDYGRSPKQYGAYPLKKRLKFLVSRLYGTRLQKSQRMSFVEFRGCRYKRVILRDSFLAAAIEASLEAFGRSVHVPPMAARYEHEIWVEYVPGRALEIDNPADVAALTDLYAALWRRGPRRVALEDTRYPYRLWSDLRFLQRVGVITRQQHDGLSDMAEQRAPTEVWIGFDFTDPVSKNFIIRDDDGCACAIDVESLERDVLLGWGIAKARARWLGSATNGSLRDLQARGGPDCGEYFGYVELCFLARWTKMGFLERKWKYVEPRRLVALLEE